MPAVLVHGVPDTAAMWDPLLAALTRDDVITLALPGFGCPLPHGFGATKDEYAGWVADQIDALGEPVDLVGHDWGSLLTQRVALTRPELLRSFAMADGAVTGRFAWHDLALQWQTPEVGEQIMELMTGDAVADALRDAGHPGAADAAEAVDDTMKGCILDLYRSATEIAREWSPTGPAERPGLVIWGTADPFGAVASGERFTEVTGAQLVVLDAAHWAPVERPREAAAALESFWASLD
ncbi:MAG: alpha/beta hydrolase [Acidimicrobiia bacterium]